MLKKLLVLKLLAPTELLTPTRSFDAHEGDCRYLYLKLFAEAFFPWGVYWRGFSGCASLELLIVACSESIYDNNA